MKEDIYLTTFNFSKDKTLTVTNTTYNSVEDAEKSRYFNKKQHKIYKLIEIAVDKHA